VRALRRCNVKEAQLLRLRVLRRHLRLNIKGQYKRNCGRDPQEVAQIARYKGNSKRFCILLSIWISHGNQSLANIVDRLRSSEFQPRKIGDDAWESRCPRHGSSDHALFLGRGRDGKLVLQCRGEQNCSFSAVLKKLNFKLRHLNRDTRESVIRRLRSMEVQLGLYQHPVPPVADPVVLPIPTAATVPDAATPAEDQDITAVAVPAPESDENTSPSSKTEPETEKTYLPPQTDAAVKGRESIDIMNGSAQESPSREIAVLEPAAESEPLHRSAGSSPATRGDSAKTRATERLQQIAAGARPFRRPDGQYSVSIAVDGHQECHCATARSHGCENT
jgi:hypothetical protein